MEDLLVLPRPAESLQKAQSSEENLEQTGDAKKEGVASAPRRAVGKDARATFAKWKRSGAISPDHQPDHEMGENQGERELHLGERERERERRIRAVAWRGKNQLHSKGRWVSSWKRKTSKENLFWRSMIKHEQMSGPKRSPGGSGGCGFTSSLTKPKMIKKVGRQRARS